MKRKTNDRAEQKAKDQKTPQPIRREIPGIVLLLAAIIFAVSLLSFHPSDRLLWNSTGPLGKAHNLFGTIGAHLAGVSFDTLGFAAFWIPIVFLALSLLSFQGRSISSPVKTLIAAVFMVVSFSAIMDLHFSKELFFKGRTMEAGGLVGLHVAAAARNALNKFGADIMLLAIFIIFLLILTRLSLGWLFSKLGIWTLGILKGLMTLVMKRVERRKRAKKTMVARKIIKAKPKVTIVDPVFEEEKMPRQEKFSFMDTSGELKLPTLDLLSDPPERKNVKIHRESLEMNARRLEKKLSDFGVEGEVVEILPGPVITMYEYAPAPGIKISKVAGLSDDLALTLRASNIRIVAPLPGKAAIGIEIPNNQREIVVLKELLSSSAYQNSKFKLPIALGKDITGAPVVADLTKMPHLLVAGATGTGKSVSINTMIESLLFKLTPDMARMLMIDPKRIELSVYKDIPHLLHPVVTEPKDATKALKWAVDEMERRYMLLSDRGVRNIETYNRKIVTEPKKKEDTGDRGMDKTLPYIIIVIDELADLMMVASKDVEESITRLAQMARAAGIHLIIATQRPSVNVLTGIIKANFPTRISFQVSSKVDSRTIIDANGAENLLGDGDMLFMPPGVGRLTRIHGAYVSEEEVKRTVDFLRNQKAPEYDSSILSQIAEDENENEEEIEFDEKYDEAVELVSKTGQASISMIQRKLRVGYNRSARMIEVMEKQGIVGPSDGVRPREVFGRRA